MQAAVALGVSPFADTPDLLHVSGFAPVGFRLQNPEAFKRLAPIGKH